MPAKINRRDGRSMRPAPTHVLTIGKNAANGEAKKPVLSALRSLSLLPGCNYFGVLADDGAFEFTDEGGTIIRVPDAVLRAKGVKLLRYVVPAPLSEKARKRVEAYGFTWG
jgi:hypothetical protein